MQDIAVVDNDLFLMATDGRLWRLAAPGTERGSTNEGEIEMLIETPDIGSPSIINGAWAMPMAVNSVAVSATQAAKLELLVRSNTQEFSRSQLPDNINPSPIDAVLPLPHWGQRREMVGVSNPNKGADNLDGITVQITTKTDLPVHITRLDIEIEVAGHSV